MTIEDTNAEQENTRLYHERSESVCIKARPGDFRYFRLWYSRDPFDILFSNRSTAYLPDLKTRLAVRVHHSGYVYSLASNRSVIPWTHMRRIRPD